ncbi:DNA-methyltransferase [Enterococcus sp. BWR-S5]|uniref:DNA-methyltransferase n=1 Tax=Enterococcus sp. BWR-S5 TaxID=2787714 RepID=UPI001F467303|nr:site-specific DNA-methyltransferase [Enterococcus sp. BWR-S5]
MKRIPDASIDLIITDPPYQIDNVKAGGNSKLAKSIQKMNDQIEENNLTQGFDKGILSEMLRVLKTPNLYIWCNHKQIPMYLDFFVKEHGCSFDIIIWKKTNAAPLFNNKYLTDKEYCLYFRKNGYCNPENYDRAKTVYVQPMNVKDKHQFGHPTIKPLNIITNLLLNSSKKNDTILDPFMGSGTTAVAAINNERNFLGFENNEEYFEQSIDRIKNNVTQMTLL